MIGLLILRLPFVEPFHRRKMRQRPISNGTDINMSDDASHLTLPATSSNDDCIGFIAALGAAKGKPIEIDASHCTQLSARFAQLLVLAGRSWTREELSFEIVAPSDHFQSAVERLGLKSLLFKESVAQ